MVRRDLPTVMPELRSLQLADADGAALSPASVSAKNIHARLAPRRGRRDGGEEKKCLHEVSQQPWPWRLPFP
jgi:hypothetical protein